MMCERRSEKTLTPHYNTKEAMGQEKEEEKEEEQ